MAGTLMFSRFRGACSRCGFGFPKGHPIVFNGSAVCRPCADRNRLPYRVAPGVPADAGLPVKPVATMAPAARPAPLPVQRARFEVDVVGPGADTLDAAKAILRDAPAHAREVLDALLSAARQAAFLRLPDAAIAAALIVGRERGITQRDAREGNAASQVADLLCGAPVALAPATPPPPAPATPAEGIDLDALDGLIAMPACSDCEPPASTYYDAPAPVPVASAPVIAQPAGSRFRRVAPPAPKAKPAPAATSPAAGRAPWA